MTCAMFLQLVVDPYIENRDLRLAIELRANSMNVGEVQVVDRPKHPQFVTFLKERSDLRVSVTDNYVVVTKLEPKVIVTNQRGK